MYENDYRIVILLIGIVIIIYLVFFGKTTRKYKVYKTKHYDLKDSINITTSNKDKINNLKDINVDVITNSEINKSDKEVLISTKKPKQMSLPLGINHKETFIIINSKAEKYYSINDIIHFMDHKDLYMNDHGYYDKFYTSMHSRCNKYSVTNMMEPGYLDRNKLQNLRIKGLSFFIRLPLEIEPTDVFLEMISDAKLFSKKFDGKLYDSNQAPLNAKIINDMKKIILISQEEYVKE